MSLPFILQVILQLVPLSVAQTGVGDGSGACVGSGSGEGRSGLQHPARHCFHIGLSLPLVLSISQRESSILVCTGATKAGFGFLPFFGFSFLKVQGF